MVIGRVLVGEGNFDAGIIRMRDAMRTLREAGGELIHSYALSLLTESYLKAREPEKGLAAVAEALKGIEASGQRMHEAEIWRLRGELLVLRGELLVCAAVRKQRQRAAFCARWIWLSASRRVHWSCVPQLASRAF